MKRLFRMIIVLSLANVLGLGVLWFAYSTIIAKEAEEVQLQKEIAEEKQKGVDFTSTAKIVTQAQKESGVLGKYFYDPGEESQINFVAQMENLGTTTGVTIETRSLDLSGGATPSFHGEFAIKGTWRSVYYFLRLLEAFPAHLTISRFNVTTGDKTPGALWTGGVSIDLVSIKNR